MASWASWCSVGRRSSSAMGRATVRAGMADEGEIRMGRSNGWWADLCSGRSHRRWGQAPPRAPSVGGGELHVVAWRSNNVSGPRRRQAQAAQRPALAPKQREERGRRADMWAPTPRGSHVSKTHSKTAPVANCKHFQEFDDQIFLFYKFDGQTKLKMLKNELPPRFTIAHSQLLKLSSFNAPFNPGWPWHVSFNAPFNPAGPGMSSA